MGWKYYNHAMIPDTPPDVQVDITALKDGSIWKLAPGKRPLLARWITDFDCGEETAWWHVIREAPYEEETLSRSVRKHIRQAHKKCTCRRMEAPMEYSGELWQVFCAAHEGYRQAEPLIPEARFLRGLENDPPEYWGAWDTETGRLIGYMTVRPYEEHAEIQTSKYDPEFLNRGPSAALHDVVLRHYLNERGFRYCDSGSRNINHVTNVQNYLIETFRFRRAYCRLHIAYRPGVGLLVRLLYPFRGILAKFTGIRLACQLSGILKMEEIQRKCAVKHE